MSQTRGIIRNESTDIVKVFNPSYVTEPISCYHDSYSNTYCIPTYTEVWMTKQGINDIGWRFVDGEDTLYDGTTQVEVVADSDPSD